MKNKLSLALMLALSTVPSVYAPVKGPSKTFVERTLETRLEYPENKYISELKEFYKKDAERIERERNYITDDFWKDKDEVLLARMLLGEAPGETKTEKIGVVFSVINRLNKDNPKRYGGESYKEIVLKEESYSAFLEDRNYLLKRPLNYFSKKEMNENVILVKEIISGEYEDPTKGATHYCNPDHPDLKGELPYWAKDPRMKKIGRIKVGETKNKKPIWSKHIFYEEIY
jgi:hypothetical protein